MEMDANQRIMKVVFECMKVNALKGIYTSYLSTVSYY